MASPPLILERHGTLNILRDDLLPGGTKRRALNSLLSLSSRAKPRSGVAEGSHEIPRLHRYAPVGMTNSIYYAGTTMGHGALALAHACKDHNKEAHIFICATDDDPMVQKLRGTNAILHLQRPMPIADLHALCMDHADGNTVFPPGFDMPEFDNALIEALSGFDVSAYPEIWTTSVTGTLSRAIKRAFPTKIFKTVSVVKSGDADFIAPEKYHQMAKHPPPYPSCPHTDAKLWQFAKQHAVPDALIWNTAG